MPYIRLLCLLGLLIATQAGCHSAPQESDADDEVQHDVDSEPGNGGCDQDLSLIASETNPDIIRYYCGPGSPDDCLSTGCGDCEVCGLDVSSGYPPGTGYSCGGDGQCHRLCEYDVDCPEAERHCIISVWSFEGHDTIGFQVHICWSGPEDSIVWL